MKSPIGLLIVGLSFCAALLSATPPEESPLWHTDWPTAQRIARESNKPIFVVMACKH